MKTAIDTLNATKSHGKFNMTHHTQEVEEPLVVKLGIAVVKCIVSRGLL